MLVAASPSAAARDVCDYDVEVSREFILDVEAACDPGVRSLAPASSSSRAHATGVHGEASESGFTGGYRLDLGALARREASVDSALAVGDSILAVGAAWLFRPQRAGGDPGVLRVRVSTPSGLGFATGQPVDEGVFEVPVAELGHAGFSAFGDFRTDRITAFDGDGGETGYRVVVLDGALDIGHAALREWIGRMAGATTEFWHGFPAPGLPMFVVPRPGDSGVPFGRVMAGGGVSLVLYVGEHATPAELDDDWVLIHELVHVGSPFVPGSPWFMEGLATYFEPLIRARAGFQTPEAMWTEFMTYMPRGAAVMAETGLARGGFRGWYWGGALLMLLADVEMRRATDGRTGLEDCLRHIRRDIGNYRHTLRLNEMIDACDVAVGGRALRGAARDYAFDSGAIDMDGLWRDLGVRLRDGELDYLDDAPLGEVRRAIIRGAPPE